MKKLFTILFFLPLFVSAQFTFTPITTEIIAPGRGAEQWNNSTDRISNPDLSNPQGTENSLDVYWRIKWTQLEQGVTQGNYVFGEYVVNGPGDTTWNDFDRIFRDAIDNRQKVSLGIMSVHEGAPSDYESYDGAISSYPEYLHDLMQAEGTTDFVASGTWVPNYNSVNHLARRRALHERIKSYVDTASYAGFYYRQVIYCIDIRGFGQYDEWHSGGIAQDAASFPAGTYPTLATFKELIDMHTEVFTDWPLVMLIAAFNGGSSGIGLFNQDPEMAHYALTASNAWGPVGWRRDQVGATDSYLETLLENNTRTFAGSPTFGSIFLNMYRYAPGTGEPLPGAAGYNLMANVEEKVALYHHTSFGNGNYLPTPSNTGTAATNIRAGFKRAGYRLEFTGGSAVVGTSTFRVNLDWLNKGVAPTYENWIVEYKLKNGGGTVVWTDTSSFTPKLFRPDQGNITATDIFTKPVLADGSYTLLATIKDTTGYRDPLPLAITGRDVDGSYLLGSVTFPGVGPRPDPEEPPPPPVPGEPVRIKWNRRFRAN